MAWNQPGHNGQDNDPWGNNKGKETQSKGNFFDKLADLFKTQKTKKTSGDRNPVSLSLIIGAAVVVIAIIWAISGFYTINQSQRGVVTRFGRVQPRIIEPGLSWLPPLIDKVYPVDTQGTRNFNVQGFMITAGENLVFVEMNVQYRVTNPIKYLFNVTNVEDSLRQAADSALRAEIGSSQMDDILTSGRAGLESRTKEGLINIISNYDMGITIVDLNFQSARPPEEVQEAFNDAIKAREDREREINKANADKVQVEQQAEGRAARIIADADAYKVKIKLEAEGDVARFEKILPEYKQAPQITRDRLYIETMEKVLTNTHKVMVSDKSGNVMLLPLEQLIKTKSPAHSTSDRSPVVVPNSSDLNRDNRPVDEPALQNNSSRGSTSRTSSGR